MPAILYLDTDDEITSAAARIRASDETRIALVVPHGSRVATSRINFRLLAREAQARGRTLAIVTPDAATRALAGSAGLDTFAAVTDYEAAAAGIAGEPEEADGPAAETPQRPTSPRRRGRRAQAGTEEPDAEQLDFSAATVVVPTPAPAGAAPPVAAASPASPPSSSTATAEPAREQVAAPGPATPPWERRNEHVAEPSSRVRRPPSLPVIRGPRRLDLERTPVAIGIAGIAIAFLVVGVAAYLLLPTATITLAPRSEPIGPLSITIRADPSVSAPDPEAGVIPAQQLTFELSASDAFPATGRRVEMTPAVGEVTFENYDPTERNVVPAGSVVRTEGGVAFRTTAAVSVPAGTLVLPEVVPGTATIGIEATRPGPEGNVPANSITVVPERENPIFLRVRNAAATSGGSRDEIRRVSRADVEGAVTALDGQVRDQFAAILADPSRVPPDTTLFPETQEMTDPVPTSDPTALVGQEIESFELALTATGTVLAVDARPVTAVADARIRNDVAEDYELIDGSIEVQPGEPAVAEGVVEFPVTARASQVRIIDAAALLAQVKGKPIEEARSVLEDFGEVTISTWPEWVGSIPTLDLRLSLTVEPVPNPAAESAPPS